MGRKIDEQVIKQIKEEIEVNTNDKEIAEKFDVSYSYVSRMRKAKDFKEEDLPEVIKTSIKPKEETKPVKVEEKNPESPKKSNKKDYILLDGDKELHLNDIELLEQKIEALKISLRWYEELLSFKKKNNK